MRADARGDNGMGLLSHHGPLSISISPTRSEEGRDVVISLPRSGKSPFETCILVHVRVTAACFLVRSFFEVSRSCFLYSPLPRRYLSVQNGLS